MRLAFRCLTGKSRAKAVYCENGHVPGCVFRVAANPGLCSCFPVLEGAGLTSGLTDLSEGETGRNRWQVKMAAQSSFTTSGTFGNAALGAS